MSTLLATMNTTTTGGGQPHLKALAGVSHIVCELERRHRRRLDEIESSGIDHTSCRVFNSFSI